MLITLIGLRGITTIKWLVLTVLDIPNCLQSFAAQLLGILVGIAVVGIAPAMVDIAIARY